METERIRFEDGAAYDRYMGAWSERVGRQFLDWLEPPPGLRWLDVGCGSGAFTSLLLERCDPLSVEGIDPSEEQLAYARSRTASPIARFRTGDAMALPLPDRAVDAAVMSLVIFFLSEPRIGVAEMARVVRPGGTVAAYAWDMDGDGFPYQPLHDEIRGIGVSVPAPPSPDASRLEVLKALWAGAGLEKVETRDIAVQRTFIDFDDYWTTVLGAPSVGPKLAAMPPETAARIEGRMRELLPIDATGRIVVAGRANAVKGRVPLHRHPLD